MRRASCAAHPLRPANPPTSGAMHPHAIVAAGPCRSELPFAAAAARPAAGMGSTPRPPPPDRSSRARARRSRSTKAAPTLHCLSTEARTHSSRSRCTHPTPLRLEARTRAASILPRYALAHALLTMPFAHTRFCPRDFAAETLLRGRLGDCRVAHEYHALLVSRTGSPGSLISRPLVHHTTVTPPHPPVYCTGAPSWRPGRQEKATTK